MLNYALVGLSVGVIGECALLLCTYASYARSDVRSPLLAMLIRLSIASCGIGVALTLALEPVLLLALGLTVSIADLGGERSSHCVCGRRCHPARSDCCRPFSGRPRRQESP